MAEIKIKFEFENVRALTCDSAYAKGPKVPLFTCLSFVFLCIFRSLYLCVIRGRCKVADVFKHKMVSLLISVFKNKSLKQNINNL